MYTELQGTESLLYFCFRVYLYLYSSDGYSLRGLGGGQWPPDLRHRLQRKGAR